MKKKGFTLMEVMLSVILFSLMVGGILGAYTRIQRANLKMANTQEAIQAAEDFLERINDTSLGYQIDTSKYNESDIVNPSGHQKFIQTGTLYLKNINTNDPLIFYKECPTAGQCILYMKDNSNKINLFNNDSVTINNLRFEIYPDQKYVNIDITAQTLKGENLYKSGITLSTSVGYKTYEKYGGELTVETLCEDVCSISELSGTGSSAAIKKQYINLMKKEANNTMSSCTLGYGAGISNNFWSNLFIGLGWLRPATETIFQVAQNCNRGNSKNWCTSYCDINTTSTNPFSCGYIRRELKEGNNGGFTGDTCSGYDNYIRATACVDMCKSSIFSCLGDEDPMIKRTGIKHVGDDELNGKYLQNPKINIIEDSQTYNEGKWTGQNGWKCTNGTINKYADIDYFLGFFSYTLDEYYKCNNSDGTLYCDGEYYGDKASEGRLFISISEYETGCVKWIREPKEQTKNVVGSRVVYTNEPTSTKDCVCEIGYTYSLNNGAVIEAGDYGGLQAITAQISYKENTTEIEYIPKKSNLIYVDSLEDGTTRDQLTEIKSRLGAGTTFKTTYCTKYNNNECTTTGAYNNYKKYRIHEGSGFYSLSDDINYNKFVCANQQEYNDCLRESCKDTCQGGTIANVYTETNSYSDNEAKEYYCEKVLGGNWTWALFFGYYCTKSLPDLSTVKKGYCTGGLNGIWTGDICYKNTATSLCVKTGINQNSCKNQAGYSRICVAKDSRGNCSVGYCQSKNYNNCVTKGEGINIYKDYDYLCGFSMTEQTNSIINIIKSIQNMSQTTTNRKTSWWRRFFG